MGRVPGWPLRILVALSGIALSACAAQSAPVTPQIVRVYATSAVYPWLSQVYDCAPPSLALSLAGPDAADLTLRLGESSPLTLPAYQIGVDDVLVVIHPQIGIGPLRLLQVRQLFSGQLTNWKDAGGADLPVQVWRFSSGEDIQLLFDQIVMQGQPITSLARLALSAQAMSDSVGMNAGSIGLLPRRWKAGNTTEAMRVSSLPVLAVLKTTPQGSLKDLLACLQKAK